MHAATQARTGTSQKTTGRTAAGGDGGFSAGTPQTTSKDTPSKGAGNGTKTRPMSDEHKEALATGRNQSRIVKAYLAALKANRPKRGRKRTPDSISNRLAKIANELPTADALQEVLLFQEQSDLERELEAMGVSTNLDQLEKDFIEVALDYSKSKGIDYATWRKVGVSAEVLAKAGIKR